MSPEDTRPLAHVAKKTQVGPECALRSLFGVTVEQGPGVFEVMSRSIREKLAALLGAATLTTALADGEAVRSAPQSELNRPQSRETTGAPTRSQPTSLRSVIERRIASAELHGRYGDLDELATLWLTLERREQLDRVVDRGEQFVSVALRNQRRSEQRAEARRSHLDLAGFDIGGAGADPGELMDAERFVLSLDEPHRSAVLLTLTGMNQREVADELGASHAAVRKWSERLRRQLDRDCWSIG